MKHLWNFVNGFELEKGKKNNLFLTLSFLFYMAVGGILWALVIRFSLPGTGWMLCFMGYPAVFIGFFGGILYLFSHQFS